MSIHKKSHLQVYLEECKYRIKKTQIPKLIKTKLKSDSDSESDLDFEKIDAKIDNELKKSDSECKNTLHLQF